MNYSVIKISPQIHKYFVRYISFACFLYCILIQTVFRFKNHQISCKWFLVSSFHFLVNVLLCKYMYDGWFCCFSDIFSRFNAKITAFSFDRSQPRILLFLYCYCCCCCGLMMAKPNAKRWAHPSYRLVLLHKQIFMISWIAYELIRLFV